VSFYNTWLKLVPVIAKFVKIMKNAVFWDLAPHPRNDILRSHRSENLKSNIVKFSLNLLLFWLILHVTGIPWFLGLYSKSYCGESGCVVYLVCIPWFLGLYSKAYCGVERLCCVSCVYSVVSWIVFEVLLWCTAVVLCIMCVFRGFLDCIRSLIVV
jgi:hypothetical protein